MSDSNLQTLPKNDNTEQNAQSDEFVLRLNRDTNEIIIRDPKTGKETALKAKLEEEKSESKKNLTVEEFQEAWNRLNGMGISWTTDIPPAPFFTEDHEPGPEFKKEYLALQKEFPNFPRELGTVILHTLLHPHKDVAVDQKAQIIKGLLSQEYRSEFFFKYAIKVPYFEDIDWEVVIKTHERGVHKMPKIAYALLMLTFRNPVDTTLSVEGAANEYREPQFMTVAVNEELIGILINKLMTVKNALEIAQALAQSIPEQQTKEG